MYWLLWFLENERGNIWLVVMNFENERGNMWLVVMILKKMKEVIMFWYCWEKWSKQQYLNWLFRLLCFFNEYFFELLYCYDISFENFLQSIFYIFFSPRGAWKTAVAMALLAAHERVLFFYHRNKLGIFQHATFDTGG